MRIAHCIRALIAVLGITALFQSVHSYQHLNESRRHRHHFPRPYNSTVPLISPGKLLSTRENKKLLQEEGRFRSEVDCCPTVREMIEPEGGENQDGNYVELFQGDYKQRFYELSCHPDILNKACRFIDNKLHQQSKCVQKYSYTYALIKDPGGGKNKNFPSFQASGPLAASSWTLDYIKVRSGCSCVVIPNRKKRGKNRQKFNPE